MPRLNVVYEDDYLSYAINPRNLGRFAVHEDIIHGSTLTRTLQGSIIHGLSSNDKTLSQKASKEADLYLQGKIKGDIDESSCKCIHNRTVINQEAFKSETLDQSSSSKEAFMSIMSKDAEERAQNKREREMRAKKFTKEGDKYIEKEDYESALHLYNKAIDEQVNWPKLFAKRATILLELRLFKRAIEDCCKAIKLNEDLLMLKGDSATTKDKDEAEIFKRSVEETKAHAIKLRYS